MARLVADGVMTSGQADEVIETLDLITSLVALGAISPEFASAIVADMADEQAQAFLDRDTLQ